MRRLSFDQHEFAPPASEQSLDLVISSPPQHTDLTSLLAACGASAVAAPPPPPGWPRWVTVADHLRRLAGVELPHPSQWRDAALISDDWNDVELGVAVGSVLVWYHWFTTA